MAGTESFGPFDSASWSTAQWYRFAMAWAPSGVIDSPAASVSTGSFGITFSGLTPTLAAGRAWVRGGGYELSGGSKTMAAIAANTNASLSRRDRIVVRRDVTAQTIGLAAIQGTPSSSPSAPAIQQNENGQWDAPLFSFLVPPNSGTTITGIVEERVWIDPGSSPVIELLAADTPLVGSLPSSFVPKMQTGTTSINTSASAIGSFAFPVPFPGGVISVEVTSLSDTNPELRVVGGGGTTVNGCQVVARKYDGTPASSTTVPLLYTAIGW